MKLMKNILDRLRRQVFNSVIENNLIYNTCWEDPLIDRELLQIDNDSRVVSITGAGCNTLDYLLDSPAEIHCVDINPAQNALLELKRVLFRSDDYNLLWKMFGEGQYSGASLMYQKQIKKSLPTYARDFWDDHIDYFSPFSTVPSFYFRGTSGTFAHIIYQRLQQKGLIESVQNLLNAKSLNEQQYFFDEIEPYVWNTFSRWLLQRNAVMALLGVPNQQRCLIDDEVTGGLLAFIQQSIRNVFTNLPITDNYFWRVYLTGSYSTDCCPNYLKKSNFELIKQNLDCVEINNQSVIKFLNKNPGCYTHFNLLDHQDWMSQHQQDKLIDEWELILENSERGTKILFRSAGTNRSFIPDFVNDYVHFEDKKAEQLHTQDRVGTYGSTHLAIVDQPL